MAKATSTRKRKPKVILSPALETAGTGNIQSTGTPSHRIYETRPTQEDIKRRAYELFLSRGGIHGNDQADWFLAEQELRQANRLAS